MTQETLDVVVAAHDRLNYDIYAIDLVPPAGRELPPFEAGAHVEVHIAEGLVRPYSLCGDPARRDRYRLGVLHDAASRGGSAAICTQWAVGQTVRISTPHNLFPLNPAASRSVLIGAGIGVTPLMAMAYQLRAWDRAFELHYCVREAKRAVFTGELADEGFADAVRTHLSLHRRFDLERDVGPPGPDDHLYVCGPQGFMDQVIARASASGWRDHQIHFEYFDVETDLTGAPFTVEIADGSIFEVGADQSIADVLLGNGIEVEISCEKGICGSCIADVVEGVPDHRDHYLTDEEKAANDCIALCCSRSKTARLRLNL